MKFTYFPKFKFLILSRSVYLPLVALCFQIEMVIFQILNKSTNISANIRSENKPVDFWHIYNDLLLFVIGLRLSVSLCYIKQELSALNHPFRINRWSFEGCPEMSRIIAKLYSFKTIRHVRLRIMLSLGSYLIHSLLCCFGYTLLQIV